MGQSYRIRTELGITKSINVELEQEFEFLEILSLKLNQTDIYLRACSDYGVLVGRVTANNGLGLPNARVSIFIPIETIDQSNPIISSIYPYKSPQDKNEDGYRYNLLPYEKSYSVHAATGTLPTRLDVLTGNTPYEIYEKYYKFTAKTNESGDYMIMGVPLGEQTIIMDVDLSDIGEFSLTPQDLIRMGRATESQVAGNRFKTSTDLNSLPQIINLSKNVEITPLWGEPSICQISINRVDFDLRDEANIDIQPTSVFIGSIYSTSDDFRIRPSFKALGFSTGERPKDNFGNLCSLTTGPGQILAVRQTINLDVSGNPILEQYKLEQNGNVIDENGAWYIEVPMNLDYFITNEFGERIVSYDPTIGIPTKAKYRFKIKWQQQNTFSASVRRPYFLVPNIKEYGWSSLTQDPNIDTNTSQSNKNKLKSSYYFGLDWSGYTQGFNQLEANTKIDDIINCRDTFYEFQFNRVYTVAGLIDQFKNGGRGRFIGIKEIDSNACEDTVNKFPVNEGFRNFDFLFFIVSLLLQVIQIISAPLIVIVHFVAFFLYLFKEYRTILTVLWAGLVTATIFSGIKNLVLAGAQTSIAASQTAIAASMTALASANTLAAGTFYALTGVLAPIAAPLGLLATNTATQATAQASTATALAGIASANATAFTAKAIKDFIKAGLYITAGILLKNAYRNLRNQKVQAFTLPTLLYPDCEACECKSNNVSSGQILQAQLNSLLTRFSDPYQYVNGLQSPNIMPSEFYINDTDKQMGSIAFAEAIGGSNEDQNNIFFYKTMESLTYSYITSSERVRDFFVYSQDLPFGERVNIFNQRKKYFDGVNKIKVSFDYSVNTNYHFDNTLTIFCETPLETGALLSFVNPNQSTDKNFRFTGLTGQDSGILGQALRPGPSQYTVEYCQPNNQYLNNSVTYNLTKGSNYTGYTFPADIEYFQVLTAITVDQAYTLFQSQPAESLPQIVNSGISTIYNIRGSLSWGDATQVPEIPIKDVFQNFNNQYIVILQRGVDPYSPVVNNKYGLGILFGSNDPDYITITASTRLNIPIQKLNSTSLSVQPFTVNGQSEIFYESKFFRGGIPNSQVVGEQWSAFTTFNVGYYGSLDANARPFGTDVTTLGNLNNALISDSSNGCFGNPVYAKYNASEDISGLGFFYVDAGNRPSNTRIGYYTKTFLPYFSANPMNINSNVLNVMRTDRLPSSDVLDGGSWALNPSLLQQNLGFAIYELDGDVVGDLGYVGYGTGADIVTQNVEGQFASVNLLTTLSVCSEVVSLKCYVGNGTGFTVNKNCVEKDAVVNGCYQFVKRPLLDIRKDIINFNEWAYRFRFFYGLCRGVLSQSFTNNWVNGSLFNFPIQVDVTFNSQNKANAPNYPKRLIYYESDSNNFYYRSSPVSGSTNTVFIGSPTITGFPEYSLNYRNLLFPTTIINLGMKDSFYKEIILEPSTYAYVMNNLESTSYSDNSDAVNLFVLSRITNARFLQQMLNQRDYSVNSLFTRFPNPSFIQPKNRVDADLVQMLSINNEVGVIPFSPEYYPFDSANPNNAVVVLAQSNNTSTMGIFFSSTTEDLQLKDFLSPGIIDFRFDPNVTAVTYRYGIKSQVVPFYQWQLESAPTQVSIFGSEQSNWATKQTDIISSEYQNLNRRNIAQPNYFVPSDTTLDVNQRGYIFNENAQGFYSAPVFPGMKSKFLIGAPFQFYFGVVKGASALDKFKQKYLPNE
jgi:hypothetical protein